MMSDEVKIKEIADEPKCDKTCGRETVAVVSIKDILRDLTLIKKYAFEKNDERIYLCADNIERELHGVRYGGAIIEYGW